MRWKRGLWFGEGCVEVWLTISIYRTVGDKMAGLATAHAEICLSPMLPLLQSEAGAKLDGFL